MATFSRANSSHIFLKKCKNLAVHYCSAWCIYVSFICAALLIQFLQGNTMGDVSLILPAHVCVCVCVSRRSNGEATSPFPSAKRTAAQAPEQPGRQSLLQPSQREFKAFHGSLCLTLFPDDNTIKATCARPPSPHPHAALPFCCLHHVLWRFICCFHVRMSPFTVNIDVVYQSRARCLPHQPQPRALWSRKIMLWLLILSASAHIQHKITLN